MDLLLVRHAEPVTIVAGEVEGPADPPLTPEGVDQARRLAAWLAHEHVDVIVSSPQRRAFETAEPVSEALGLQLEVVE